MESPIEDMKRLHLESLNLDWSTFPNRALRIKPLKHGGDHSVIQQNSRKNVSKSQRKSTSLPRHDLIGYWSHDWFTALPP